MTASALGTPAGTVRVDLTDVHVGDTVWLPVERGPQVRWIGPVVVQAVTSWTPPSGLQWLIEWDRRPGELTPYLIVRGRGIQEGARRTEWPTS